MATVAQEQTQSTAWRRMSCRFIETPAYRARIGVVALANDISLEPELRSFLPAEVAMYVNRIDFPDRTSPETLRGLREDIATVAARILPEDPLDVVVFACTSGTMAIGEDVVAERIHGVRPGVAVTDPVTAGLAGLRRLGCRRIALLTPYSPAVNELVETYVRGKGMDIAVAGSFGCDSARDMCNVDPSAISEAVLELGAADVDGVFVSCTALRVSPVIDAMEQRLGKPVVASNQALAWHAMQLAGAAQPVPDRGSLLRMVD